MSRPQLYDLLRFQTEDSQLSPWRHPGAHLGGPAHAPDDGSVAIYGHLGTSGSLSPPHRTYPKLGALSGGCSGKIDTDEKSQPPNSFFKEAKQIW